VGLNRNLLQLAKLYGVLTSYRDMWGRRREASADSVLLALQALGAPVESMADVGHAIRARRSELENRLVEPVITAWDGRLPELKLPRNCELRIADCESPVPKFAIRNSQFEIPYGYHRLLVEARGQVHESLVISAPKRAFFPLRSRAWGVFAPAYALGNLTAFESFGLWIEKHGGRLAATLPLLACFMERPYEPSPYSPVSRLFWNEFYVDPSRAPEFEAAAKAAALPAAPPRRQLVDYAGEMRIQRRILEELARTFFSSAGSRRRAEFENFLKAHPAATDYARFRAATDRMQQGWRGWPERMRAGDLRPEDYSEEAFRYHLYAQWLTQEQISALAAKFRSRGALLYLDLPLGIHPDGYDVWRHRDLFLKGMSGGSPPDPVFTVGQNWGFPPMNPQTMRTSFHRYTIAYIQNHLQYAGLLRIDHVMGLHRLYCIPDGMPGERGVYVEYPAEELYAILSLESHKRRAGIVGENLGTVPPEVNRAIVRHNIQQMYVVQYEISADPKRDALRTPPAHSVAGLNTHDMPPFRAFLDGLDIPDRLDLGFLDPEGARRERKSRERLRKALTRFLRERGLLKSLPAASPEEIFRACLEFLGRSPAAVVLVNLEDLWQETNPQNIPSTGDRRPNWRRRLRYSVEELEGLDGARTMLEMLNSVRAGRGI